jgi:hypothetical protein
MDISADNYKSDINRPNNFSTVLQTLLGTVRWLGGFFTLTEEDRILAGIYLGSEERDN